MLGLEHVCGCVCFSSSLSGLSFPLPPLPPPLPPFSLLTLSLSNLSLSSLTHFPYACVSSLCLYPIAVSATPFLSPPTVGLSLRRTAHGIISLKSPCFLLFLFSFLQGMEGRTREERARSQISGSSHRRNSMWIWGRL
jgi:hypothetical protein